MMAKEAFFNPGFFEVGVDFLHNLADLAVHFVFFNVLLSHRRAFTESEAAMRILSFVECIVFALLVLLLMSLLLFLLVVRFILITLVIYVLVFLVARSGSVRVLLTVRPILPGRVAFFVFGRSFLIIYLFLILVDVCIFLHQLVDLVTRRFT